MLLKLQLQNARENVEYRFGRCLLKVRVCLVALVVTVYGYCKLTTPGFKDSPVVLL